MSVRSEVLPVYRFGPFELDPRSAELRRNGVKLKIQEQPYHVLLQLLEHPGEIVSREELRASIWPADTFVDFETGLNTVTRRLRETLGDSAGTPTFIETIPRRGYRFVAPVATQPRGSPPTRPPEQVTSRARSRYLLWAASAVAIALLALLVTNYLEKRRSHPLLTEEDTIVVGDFTNSTGDPVFDDTLKQAVSIVLQQSPRVRILSDQKIRETLGLMERSPDAALNEATAREVCQRTGSSALLAGSISSLASQYVLGLKAVNCGDGDVLALEQAQAAKKEDVLRALDPMVTNLRSRLGESLASVQKFDTPLEQATTPSLEALKAYSLGVKAVTARSPMAGIPFVNRAIELDPNFALAYSLLGDVYGALLVESGLAAENMRKAYVLRDRVSERERFHIRQSTKIGLAMASTRDVRVVAALTLASAGDIGQAEKMAAELEKQNSSNTAISRHWLPTIRAYIAIKQRNPARALNALEPAAPYDLAFPPPQFEEGGLLYPAYVRGQAYLMLRRGKESAGEFQKLLDHRGILINSPLGALARLGLAHAFTLQGDSAKTRATYQDFLTVWKDADPNIPILKQAKAEYAKLQ